MSPLARRTRGTTRMQRRSGATTRHTAPARGGSGQNPFSPPRRGAGRTRGRGRGASTGLAPVLGIMSLGGFGLYILTVAIMVSLLMNGNFAGFAQHAGAFLVGVCMIFVGLALGIAGCLARGSKVLPLIGLLLNGLPFVWSLVSLIAQGG